MKVVQTDGWVRDSDATQEKVEVGVNMNAAAGPAPGGYLMMRGVEVFITLHELRKLWDAWTEFNLPRNNGPAA